MAEGTGARGGGVNWPPLILQPKIKEFKYNDI